MMCIEEMPGNWPWELQSIFTVFNRDFMKKYAKELVKGALAAFFIELILANNITSEIANHIANILANNIIKDVVNDIATIF